MTNTSICGYDLDFMILERVRGEQLQAASRVNKRWRKHISNNIHKMRSVPCRDIVFDFSNGGPDITVSIVNDENELINKRYTFVSSIYRYKPTHDIQFGTDCRSIYQYMPPHYYIQFGTDRPNFPKIKSILSSIPAWWIEQIKVIDCCLIDHVVFGIFTAQLRHISRLLCMHRSWFQEEYIAIINRTQQVDLFDFVPDQKSGMESIAIVSQALIQKSLTNPMRFPIFSFPIAVEEFIDLFERINLLKLPEHIVQVKLRGSLTVWNEWFQRIAPKKTTKRCLCFRNNFKHTFEYRNVRFVPTLDSYMQ